MQLTLTYDRAGWGSHLAALGGAHLLQSWDWGEFKARHGWTARRFVWEASGRPVAAASVLRRGRLPAILYVPRGPTLDWANASVRGQVLGDLERLARQERAIFVKIDPAVVTADGPPDSAEPCPTGETVRADLLAHGWQFSSGQVQFRNTVQLDLLRPEADVLAAMKQKTRYNIRLAARRGVRVRPGAVADLPQLYHMYAETSLRDGFAIRAAGYYQDAWGTFMAAGQAQPFLADVGGEIVAGVIVFRFGQTAIYMYGMSTAAHRDLMPNHLLQWEAIRWARQQGCSTYDFWGAPDRFEPGDSMWGVWKFKEGFGGRFVQTIGAWDYVASPTFYRLYTRWLPRLLNIMRRMGRQSTQASLAGGGP